MHRWYAVWRIDTEEVFTTDNQTFNLDTMVLSEAAKLIEADIGSENTLITLKRVDV